MSNICHLCGAVPDEFANAQIESLTAERDTWKHRYDELSETALKSLREVRAENARLRDGIKVYFVEIHSAGSGVGVVKAEDKLYALTTGGG